uniref:Uncharacterized protein n=1 Tax=Panagrolaimus sp. JU765 TaxID=591449 RepID=A0AC34QK66_9BILA
MNCRSAVFLSFLLVVLLSSALCRPRVDEELLNSLILRKYRPYNGRIFSYLEPRRVTRQGDVFGGEAPVRRSC